MKYSYIIVVIILLIIIYYYLNNNYKYKYGQKYNYNVNKKENNVTYLFWTGGFDSTFRLCQLLIDQKKKVRPLYIASENIDGSNTKFSGRSSKQKEMKSMDKIIDEIYKKFPFTKELLLPTYYVEIIPTNKIHQDKFKQIHTDLKAFSRPVNQYERMSRFSSTFHSPIEIGIEKKNETEKNSIQHLLKNALVGDKIKKNIPAKYELLSVFNNIRFPLINLTKNDMYKIAKKNNYDDILKLTWSCWTPFFGTPCGFCNMCNERLKM